MLVLGLGKGRDRDLDWEWTGGSVWEFEIEGKVGLEDLLVLRNISCWIRSDWLVVLDSLFFIGY